MTRQRKPPADHLPIVVRAYVPADATGKKPMRKQIRLNEPSEWVLIFDTETSIDTAQRLRIGVYQLRKSGALAEAGIFHDPDALPATEQQLLRDYASAQGLRLLTRAEFVEDVFFGMAYGFRATIVGFNIPFDLSRLAIGHAPARKPMIGGFSFQLSENPNRPRVQVKHLSRTAALFKFTGFAEQRTPRGIRNRKVPVAQRRGFFVDIKTLAAALTGQGFSLVTLADFLETPHRKIDTDEHGGSLTEAYIGYAVNDVQVTWNVSTRSRLDI